MDAQPIQHGMTNFEMEQRRLDQRNRDAVLTMWTGLGAILSLLLTCFLGSLLRTEERTTASVVVMVLLLIVTVVLYFALTKKDERWYLVCSLLNHAGIGLAVLILLDVLGIDIRLKQLALSGLPAAAVFFGIIMIYVGLDGEGRNKLLYVGAVGFGAVLFAALLKFSDERTEFWLCMAICALLSCANFCVLIWSAGDPEGRSVCKGLAVVSFAIYLILAVIAVVLFMLAMLSNSSGRSSDKKRLGKIGSKGGSKKSGLGSGSGLGTGALGSGVAASSGSVRAPAGAARTVYGTRTYIPVHYWFNHLYFGPAYVSRSAAASNLSAEEQAALDRRLRRRRRIIFCVIAAVVIVVIVLAVVFGRG